MQFEADMMMSDEYITVGYCLQWDPPRRILSAKDTIQGLKSYLKERTSTLKRTEWLALYSEIMYTVIF